MIEQLRSRLRVGASNRRETRTITGKRKAIWWPSDSTDSCDLIASAISLFISHHTAHNTQPTIYILSIFCLMSKTLLLIRGNQIT